MRFSAEVRCLHCGNDALDARSDPDVLDILARAHVWCPSCDRTFRLSLSMVRVNDEALTAASG